MNELKNLFNEYSKAVIEANKADSEWEGHPSSKELEDAFDKAYEKEFELFEKLTDKIVEIGKGKISRGTAHSMVNTRFEDLEELINRIA